MTAREVRTPGGNRASAGEGSETVISLPTASATGKGKTGRTRFVRFFPERLTYAIEYLSPIELVAWLRLTAVFTVRDGMVQADDELLARLTRAGRHWPDLRDKLITLGFGRIEGERWIDDDQQANLDIQNRLSGRGTKGAMARWGQRRA